MDVTSDADERPSGLLGLVNPTRSDAHARTVIRTDVSRPLRRHVVPVDGGRRHPKTVTKAHVQRTARGHGIFVRGHVAAKNFRKTFALSDVRLIHFVSSSPIGFLFYYFFSKGNTTEIPSGQGRLNIYNGFDCDVFVRSESMNVQDHIGPLEVFNVTHAVLPQVEVIAITLGFGSECIFLTENYELNTTVTMIEGEVNDFFMNLH